MSCIKRKKTEVEKPVHITLNNGDDGVMKITHNEAYLLWRKLNKIYGGK
tara:strand:+ start:5904 stop:6050 length:147 start_codon:yes stop_codon:yes gene_type:complete